MNIWDTGTIVFNRNWAIQQSIGFNTNTTYGTTLTYVNRNQGTNGNGGWSINATICAEYIVGNNYMTLYYNNAPFTAGGSTGVATTISSFYCRIKETGYTTDTIWIVPDNTTNP